MNKISKYLRNHRRLVIFIIIAAILVYIGYMLLSNIFSGKSSSVHVTMYPDSKNIATGADATYKLSLGDGNLSMSTSADASLPKGAVSYPVELKTVNGDTVEDAKLTFKYTDDNLPCDEMVLAIAEIKDGKPKKIADYKADYEQNTITVTVDGKGRYCLINIKEK